MIGLRNASLTAVLACGWLGSTALAQTAASLAVVSGNGQLVCPACLNTSMTRFEPLVVLATDAQGAPVSGATVNWSVVSAISGNSLAAAQTVTGTDGTSSNTLNVVFTSARSVYSVVASLPNTSAAVIFTLTAGAQESSTDYAIVQVPSGRFVTITGTAGGTGSPAIQVKVQDFGAFPISNISVRLIPDPSYTPGASVACATAAGADPGSVLTDNTGLATCTPVMGPIAGTGTYQVLVGGVAKAQLNGTGPLGYTTFGPEFIQVNPGVPGAMKIISGSPQSANPGQALAAALVAEVDTASGTALSGVPVTWSVTPAGAATLSSTTTTSDANGRVSTNVTLTNSASGAVQVTASTGSFSVSFSINVNITISGLTKASGDGQTAALGQAFAQALTVQVNAAANQSGANIPVQFAISGPGTLSATSVTTNSSGQASVTVTAGSTAGAITVTASTGPFSVSFNLTVAPPGPSITPTSFVNGAGFYNSDQIHSALTPCGVGAVIAPGIAPNIQGIVTSPMFGPLSYQLAQVTISFGSSRAPLYSVSNVNGQQQASFQVPCDVTPSDSVPVTVTVNGVSKTVNVLMRVAGPGVFVFTDSDNLQHAVVVRSDGSYASATNRVQPGETVRLYITGMGQVQPAVATNSVPVVGTDSIAQGNVVVAINNTGMRVVSARRAPNLVGVDEVTFQVDASAPTGNQVLYVAVGLAGTFDVSNASLITLQ